MKKKVKVLIALMAMALMMNGCEKQAGEVKSEAQTIDYEEAGSTYTCNTGVAFMDTGFYYQNVYGQLMYFDDETNQVVYVCSKPNCKHDPKDDECNANIHGNSFSMVYRNGRLYYTSTIEEDIMAKIVMFSIKPDGSDRKEEGKIGEIEIGITGYSVELYKHYATMSCDTDTYQKIELLDIDTGERNVICESDDKLKEIYGPNIFYDEVYYGECEYDKAGNKINEIFYRYNIKTKKVSTVYEGKMETRAFTKGYLIFSDGEAINRLPLVGGKVEKLFDYKEAGELRYDGKYLYVEHDHDYKSDVSNQKVNYDDHWVEVMKLDGTKVDKIKWNNRGPCLFGNERVLLFMNVQETGEYETCPVAMKKSDIGGEHHFIDLANGKPYDKK